jgi:hypothetical protein
MATDPDIVEMLAAQHQADVVRLRSELAAEKARTATLEARLSELLTWAYDACLQGTGNEFGTPRWHINMSTWEEADDLLPEIAALLAEARAEAPR